MNFSCSLRNSCSFCGCGSHVSICRHWIVRLFGEQMFLELSFFCFWMLKIFFLLPKICWKSCRKTRAGMHPAISRFSAAVYSNWAISTAWLRCLYSRYFVLLIVGLSFAFSLGLESKRPYVSTKLFNLMERHSLRNFLLHYQLSFVWTWLEKML